jgi:hypothetical protein
VALKRSLNLSADSPFSVRIGPARLYLDEVRDIRNALLEFGQKLATNENNDSEAAGPIVELSAATATADEIEDLKDATRKELNHITLALSAPRIRIDLWREYAEIIAESDTAEVRRFVEIIADFIARYRSWRAFLRPAVGFFAFPAILFALYVALPDFPKSWDLYIPTKGGGRVLTDVLGIMALVATLGYAGIFTINRRATIYVVPDWHSESRGLSIRSRRDLAVALIAAVFSAVIIALAGLWAGVFASK